MNLADRYILLRKEHLGTAQNLQWSWLSLRLLIITTHNDLDILKNEMYEGSCIVDRDNEFSQVCAW